MPNNTIHSTTEYAAAVTELENVIASSLKTRGALEDIANDALEGFLLTQHPGDYSSDHWANRLIRLKNSRG